MKEAAMEKNCDAEMVKNNVLKLSTKMKYFIVP